MIIWEEEPRKEQEGQSQMYMMRRKARQKARVGKDMPAPAGQTEGVREAGGGTSGAKPRTGSLKLDTPCGQGLL